MMIAFVFNGLCTFGLRILAGLGWATDYTAPYLGFWYLAGALFLLIGYVQSKERVRKRDVAVGGALGLFSAGGQTCLGLALAQGLPGSTVYPVVLAGGLFIVVTIGVTVFKERIGPAGIVGITFGVLSIVLLSLQ